MRRILRSAASDHRTVTYGELMKICRLPRGPLFSRVLGRVDTLERTEGAPGFAAIVVRKDTRFPGGGYFCDDDLPPSLRRPAKRSTDPRLTSAERRHVRSRQEAIWSHYSQSSTT